MGRIEVTLADRVHVDGILHLQAANLELAGGMLSAEFPRAWFETWLGTMPVLAALDEGMVVGYLLSSTVPANRDVGVIQAMLREIELREQHIIYGPICVAERHRGKGIASLLYRKLLAILPGKTPITFIRKDNEASLAAHAALGMIEIGAFTYRGRSHAILETNGS